MLLDIPEVFIFFLLFFILPLPNHCHSISELFNFLDESLILISCSFHDLFQIVFV